MIRFPPRALVALPIALLATGCVTEPYTPSSGLERLGEGVPSTRATTLPAFHDAALRWDLPATDPWAPFVKLTLLSALGASPRAGALPDIGELGVVERARRAAGAIAAGGLPADAMWVVDLRGAASVAFGATLSQRATSPVAPVITFNNWPAERELVPAEETLAALLAFEPRVPVATAEPTIPVFLLDSWRLAYRDGEPPEDVTDNRYMLTPGDLPSVELLRARGIERVLYVVETWDGDLREEDDLHATFAEYQDAGIAIHIVDLEWLMRAERMPEPAAWTADLTGTTVYIEPRSTLVQDPAFYGRAHGGFGGVHGGPSSVGHTYHAASAHMGGHGGG